MFEVGLHLDLLTRGAFIELVLSGDWTKSSDCAYAPCAFGLGFAASPAASLLVAGSVRAHCSNGGRRDHSRDDEQTEGSLTLLQHCTASYPCTLRSLYIAPVPKRMRKKRRAAQRRRHGTDENTELTSPQQFMDLASLRRQRPGQGSERHQDRRFVRDDEARESDSQPRDNTAMDADRDDNQDVDAVPLDDDSQDISSHEHDRDLDGDCRLPHKVRNAFYTHLAINLDHSGKSRWD